MNLSQTIELYCSADFMGPGAIAVPAYAKKKRKKMKAATVRRINNPAPVDGPEQYETVDTSGDVSEQFEDKAGAEEHQNKSDRKRFGLKGYPALKRARKLKNGDIKILDNRQRNTTGGTGGTGGAGNG